MNEDDNVSLNESDNVSVNENDNDNKNESESESDNESENGDEQYYIIKQLNNWFKTIDETKSFEQRIEILKKRDFLDEYWHGDYHGDKELNIKIFIANVAYLINDLGKKLFEKIFAHKFVALADKLINTRSKEENQIFINDIKKKIEIKFTRLF